MATQEAFIQSDLASWSILGAIGALVLFMMQHDFRSEKLPTDTLASDDTRNW